MKFRKKPVVIEAIQWDGTNKTLKIIRRFMKPNYPARGTESPPDCLIIHTLEGDHRANVGDWIIRGVKSEFYPCKPDIFEQTYEHENDKPKIICLCGSSRFIWYFAVMAWNFEKVGVITLGLHLLPENYTTEKVRTDHIAEWEGVAVQMDELHRKKIDMCDEVFVINVDGYIGKSTASEIEYATKLGKPIKYLINESKPIGG